MAEIEKIMPVTRVKRDLLNILKTMEEDQSTITVTRNGEPVSIMMTPDRYDALMETIEILSDKEVLNKLAESSEDFKSGRVYKDKEVWQD
ncbi:MAG: type II toxin-antitoxin system prevent-host-death family antitoxin [Proteobacteria bacterium]|nr:type II toxin-antitoxin system prevent-host-death family antitoxin [Pseudomonadota bacterium]